MGNSNTVNVVILLIVISVYGLVWGQHLSCPAQDWTLGSTITLRCYLLRVDYPSKCTFNFIDRVTFRRRPFTGSASDRCTVNNVTTTSCTPSSSECGCQPANATYFMVHHTFTVDADDEGTWECSVTCLNDDFLPVLTFTSDHCDNREVVAHAVLSTPTITVTTPDTGSGWTVRGTVDITRIFSSTGDYSCMWSYRRDSGQYTDITSPDITFDPPASGTAVKTGQCDFPDRPLSSDPGTYTYRVTVSPGQTVKTDSSVVIETPVISSSNCDPSTVAEDGEVTCTCNANVGQPAGRLRWFMESTTGTTAIEDGQYGDGTLTVRHTVNRNQHGNKLWCEVDWITDITGPDFTLQVAYEPTETKLTVNSNVRITVNEGEAVALVCQSRGRPTPRLELLQSGVVLASEDGGQLSLSEEMSRLSHSIFAMCNNTGTFICRADNDVGNGQEISADVTVNCKPRRSGGESEVPKVNFRDNAVSVAFRMEAYPLPDRHRFLYLGNTLSPENSQQSVPENVELSATCTNTNAKYVVECSVTVDNVKDKSAEGFYLYTAVNDFGEASFEFQITVNARRDDGGGVDAAAIGAGTAAAVLVIVVVAVVVFLIRRKRRKRSMAQRRGHNADQDEPEMIVNDLYGRSPGTADDAPRVADSGGASGGAYEEVALDKGTNGVTNVQQQPGPSGAGADNVYAEAKKPKNSKKSTPQAAVPASETANVYAKVKKSKKSTPPVAAAADESANVYAKVKKSKKSTPPVAAAADETANVYAVVVKTQGKLDMSPRTAEPGPSARPKPAPKPKTKKGKQNNTAGQRAQEAEGSEYGNTAPLPGAAHQAEGSVSGDNGFQKDDSDPAGADAVHARSEVPQAVQDDDGSHTVNADGLVYTTVAFTESQRQKEKEPVAEREFTEYSGLDFTKMAAETKNK